MIAPLSTFTPTLTARPTLVSPQQPTSLTDTFAPSLGGKDYNYGNIAKMAAGTLAGAGLGVYAGLATGILPGVAGAVTGGIGLAIAGVLVGGKLGERFGRSPEKALGGALWGGILGGAFGAVAGGTFGVTIAHPAAALVLGAAGAVAGFGAATLHLANKEEPKP